jgi:hypothetical protein
LGQLLTVDRDSQSNCRVNWNIMGVNPVSFRFRREEAAEGAGPRGAEQGDGHQPGEPSAVEPF